MTSDGRLRRRRRRAQQPGHRRLPGACRLRVLVLDARADPRRRRRLGGAARPRLPGRLLLDRAHADPDEPAAPRRRARADRPLRARLHRARPVRPRRVPGRRAAHDVARPRPQLRGARALLAARRRLLPAAARRLRRRQAPLRRQHASPRPVRPRRSTSCWPNIRRRALAPTPADERLGRRPARFESPHVHAFMLWQAFQTLVPVDAPGSGPLAYSIVFGRQRRGWTIPRGGSGQLTEALVARSPTTAARCCAAGR